MSLLSFIFKAFIISLSGVMAPGPMTAVTIGKGNKSPYAGMMIALGHGIIEFPLIAVIYFGLGFLFQINYIKPSILLIGGILLFLMGIDMLRNIKKNRDNENIESNKSSKSSSIVTGILLSAGNPYFLLWWATVGATIILQASDFGILGLVIFIIIHWFCDFFWLYFLSIISFKGGQYFGKNFQRISFLICSIFLIIFSIQFIYDSVRNFINFL